MSSANRLVAGWLLLVCAVIVAMIVVGGVTRLTGSGLSMVDWRPIMGIVPPLNEAEWEAAFEAYQQFPEYQKVNRFMDLEGFKEIFFWEYWHRVLGRVIGIVFFVPFVALWLLGKIDRVMLPRLAIALVLGGLQGLLGWYMVKSGLVDMPRVSHYRLAAHLLLALFILAYLFWLILSLLGVRGAGAGTGFRNLVYALAAVTVLQILYGAFTAGIRAGYGFNTFPLMDNQFMADAVFYMTPWWMNLFESTATIQFIHRWLGAVLLLIAFATWLLARRQGSALKWAAALVLGALLVQFILGVLTLVYVVPLSLASLHQAWACVVLLALVALLYHVTVPARPTGQ